MQNNQKIFTRRQCGQFETSRGLTTSKAGGTRAPLPSSQGQM